MTDVVDSALGWGGVDGEASSMEGTSVSHDHSSGGGRGPRSISNPQGYALDGATLSAQVC